MSKAVADSDLYELRRQLEYKAQWTGREVIIVDRTSKTCSGCGLYQQEMLLKYVSGAVLIVGRHTIGILTRLKI